MASGLVSERPAGAAFLLLEVESRALPAASVASEPVAALVVEAGIVLAVAAPLPDDKREDDEGDGLGHKLLYTNCSGSPLQAVADPELKVPFG